MRSRRRATGPCLAVSAAALLIITVTAWATVGAGISAAPVTLGAKKAVPGRSYDVKFSVQNTGDVRTRYTLFVERFARARGRPVPRSWVSFFPRRPLLRAGEIRQIRARIRVPPKAKTGPRMSLITLSTGASTRPGSGATPRVGSSTLLSFRVARRASPPKKGKR